MFVIVAGIIKFLNLIKEIGIDSLLTKELKKQFECQSLLHQI
jgi:hypothetical protein